MNVLRIALILLLPVSLTGCDKFFCRNTATIEVNGLRPPKACPILIDPSLKPQVNETTNDSRDFFWRMDTKQRVIINNSGPLKLVPATPEEVERLMAAEKASEPKR